MNYLSVKFDKVFEDVVRAAGRPQETISLLTADENERVCDLINQSVLEFWEAGFWPGTFEIEQRTIDSTGKHVLKEADGETAIGLIDPDECFYEDLPEPGSLRYVLGMVEDRGDRIVCFDDDCPAQPYIRFQVPCPQFTKTDYAAGTTYSKGDLAYDSDTGETYQSLADSNIGNAVSDTDSWVKLGFPSIARTFVKLAASAEWMSEDDGKYKQSARAMRELERLEDRWLPRLPVGR